MGYCPSVYRAITHCTATGALRDIRAMSLRIIQQRVRERLDATGISMKAASKEVGGETLVRDLLERDREPSATRLQRLAEVLGCTLAYLTGETDALVDGEQFRFQPPCADPMATRRSSRRDWTWRVSSMCLKL